MEAFLWSLKSRDAFQTAGPLLFSLAMALVVSQSDFIWLLIVWFWKQSFRRRPDPFVPGAPGSRPIGLVIIPSLLRDRDDFTAITITVESCALNKYPSELIIIASVDGRREKPELYNELLEWVHSQNYPKNVRVYVGGNETRLGKMMAVEAAVVLMHKLVDGGGHKRFPDIYFSIDGDGTLGERALERLADRLTTPHPITKLKRRVVAGKVCIRPDLFWHGFTWKSFQTYFTVQGQIYRQVAREFILSNVARFNWKITPKVGIPGGLYCCWTDLLIAAPQYMGFMKTIKLMDWVKWWFGAPPPRFSTAKFEPCPEALAGASDDTCMAFLASISRWGKDGRLVFDAPRTPFHCFGRFLHQFFIERSHDYAPEARVYTYTPPTLKGLWIQRVRWNSSRFECAGRFWRAFLFHWDIGLPVSSHLTLVLVHVFTMLSYYVLLPYYVFGTSLGLTAYLIGYTGQMIGYAFYTSLALLMEKQWREFLPAMLCLPLAPLYSICINFFGCVYGVTRDVFFFGNTTKFAPEWTLKKGRTERIAIMFRVRRFLALSVRAVVVGDVPFGSFWWGWGETPWTPSGYEGWTSNKEARSIIPPMSEWFKGRRGGLAKSGEYPTKPQGGPPGAGA